jgi:hypothetical protein
MEDAKAIKVTDAAPVALVRDTREIKIVQSLSHSRPFVIRLGHRVRALQGILLALVAVGMLWNNVLLFWIPGFPVTLTTAMTAGLFVFGIGNWIGSRYGFSRLILPSSALLLYELVVHGILGNGIGDAQWPRSFALLVMCAGLLVASSRYRISELQLPTLAKWLSWSAYLMGGLGIVQFVVANAFGLVWNPLPEVIALGGAIAETDASRFGGLFRARGISGEYSYYGMGMVVLAALCFALLSLAPPDRRSRLFRGGALLMALGGVVASASFAAWGVLAVVVFTYLFANPGIVFRYRKVLGVSLVLAIAAGVFVWPFLQDRFMSVLTNPDDSGVNYRLRAGIDLIVAPADDFPSALVGTGVGLDSRNPAVLRTFEKYFSAAYLDWVLGGRTNVVIVNSWAYLVVTMGWIGLALNGWLLAAVFAGRRSRSFPTLPLLALSVGYLFAIGSYLSPEWWASLELIYLLRTVRSS